jgi:uncharacterized Zn-finger protein
MAQAAEGKKIIEVTRKDLPLCCPGRTAETANLHPRVYLSLKNREGVAVCPYCSARYRLAE